MPDNVQPTRYLKTHKKMQGNVICHGIITLSVLFLLQNVLKQLRQFSKKISGPIANKDSSKSLPVSILCDRPASKVKLAFRFGFVCSEISELMMKFIRHEGSEQ